MSECTLYDYWRSSAAYRVRIALNVKGIAYVSKAVNLLKGEQRDPAYLAQNPQGAVPMLGKDGLKLTQSLAIIAYLEEMHPAPPLMPKDPAGKAHARAMAMVIAMDVHPVINLRVQQYLTGPLKQPDEAKGEWYRHWCAEGFTALEKLVREHGSNGRFCIGDHPTIADLCLIPQLYNSRRFKCALEPYPMLLSIEAHCNALPAFDAAKPEKQPDAV